MLGFFIVRNEQPRYGADGEEEIQSSGYYVMRETVERLQLGVSGRCPCLGSSD